MNFKEKRVEGKVGMEVFVFNSKIWVCKLGIILFNYFGFLNGMSYNLGVLKLKLIICFFLLLKDGLCNIRIEINIFSFEEFYVVLL